MYKFSGRDYKDKARFTALARCPLGRLPDSFVAKASLASLKNFLPDGQESKPDLLAIAGNAFVANLVNANGDSINSEDALLLYPTFINKPINLEHEPEKIVGSITKSFLTSFDIDYKLGSGSDILEADSVKDSLEPFNVAVAGFVYADIFPHVANKIVESNDPESKDYLTVSFSWEVAFDKWNLLVGSKELSKATVISDEDEVEKWTPYLKSKGGSGSLPDGRPVYRQIVWAKDSSGNIDKESLYGVGMALTMAPAGDVRGVITENFEEKEDESEISLASQEKNEKNISTNDKVGVTANTNIIMKSLKTLEDVKALNDENAKEYSFANIANVLDAGVTKLLSETISEKAKAHEDAIKAKENELAQAIQKAEQAQASIDELSKKNQDLEAKLNEIKAEQEKAAASQLFNERMNAFDSKYELTDSDRKAIANRIKGLSEEEFTKVSQEELEVFLAPKDKALAKEKAKASETTDPKEVAKETLEKVVASEDPKVPNSPSSEGDLATKYKNAFSLENITKQ